MRVSSMLGGVRALGLAAAISGVPHAASEQEGMAGAWEAELRLNGGQVRFTIEISVETDRRAVIRQGAVLTATARVAGNADELVLEFSQHASRIRAVRVEDALYGEWTRERVGDDGESTEAVPFNAMRVRGVEMSDPVAASEMMVSRWRSDADECGSAMSACIRSDSGGSVILQTVSADGGVLTYAGGWDTASGQVSLQRFDGVEAQVVEALRQNDGSIAGQIWTGLSVPSPWTIRPALPRAP